MPFIPTTTITRTHTTEHNRKKDPSLWDKYINNKHTKH
jgi:hypothetical protein